MRTRHAHFLFLILSSTLALTSGCLTPSTVRSTSALGTTTTASTLVATDAGEKAVKIIFTTGTGGSFSSSDSKLTTGTAVGLGNGLKATTLYTLSGDAITSSSSNWPKWLSYFEIGISGASNTVKNTSCARFATDSESSLCTDSVGTTYTCSVYNYFRISEYDCYTSTQNAITEGVPAGGSGGTEDPIYMRAVLSRDTTNLGSGENIMAVLEYSASGVNAASTSPANCFGTSGTNLANCSDLVWNAYLWNQDSVTTANPFLTVIPPLTSQVEKVASVNLGATTTRQIIIPLAGNSAIKVFQLGRIPSLQLFEADGTTLLTRFDDRCKTGNSPLCAGVVFHSLTFYRI